MRVSLGPPERFPEGKLTTVDLRGEEGVFDEAVVWRWHDRLYAVRNYCSHQGGPLCRGRLVPRVTADREGGGLNSDGDVPLLRCPWHRWEFDPATGRAIVDPAVRLKTWPITVENGNAFLEITSTRRMNVTAAIKTDASREGGHS
jgi:nitrite reductase (NADH) small subunit